MMLKTGIKVAHDYSIFEYVPPIPHKNVKSQYRTIVSGTGVNLETKNVLPENSKEKVGKETPPYAFLMDNLETSFSTTVNKAHGNTGGSTMERFIKPIASTMFGHPVYSLDGTGPSIEISGPHEIFFNSSFRICICGDFPGGCSRLIRLR